MVNLKSSIIPALYGLPSFMQPLFILVIRYVKLTVTYTNRYVAGQP